MVQLDVSKDEQSDNTKTVCDIAVPDDTREEINTQEEILVTTADDSGDHSSEINDLSDDKAGPCETWYLKKRFQEGKDKLTENPRISMSGKKIKKISTKSEVAAGQLFDVVKFRGTLTCRNLAIVIA